MSTKQIIGIVGLVVAIGAVGYWLKQPRSNGLSSVSDTSTNVLGERLAGKASEYRTFTKTTYDEALADPTKVILLDFYANWCPICRAEQPVMLGGFDALTTHTLVGFRVNFKDNDTDADEKTLAEQLKVPYQHTKIFLKNGREISRSTDAWSAADFTAAVTAATNQS